MKRINEKQNSVSDQKEIINRRYKDKDYVHYVYKIVNKTNGKYYIGIHSFPRDTGLTPETDGYWGSGNYIREAIREEGHSNFEKIILKTFSTRSEISDEEKRLVTIKEVNDPMCYNATLGGDDNNGASLGWVICRLISDLDKVIKIPREEYHKNKGVLYISAGHLKYYLEGPVMKNINTKSNPFSPTYKKRFKKNKTKYKLDENDTLFTRVVRYVNKDTLEIISCKGHEEPSDLYNIWFPAYFLDKVNNKFITAEYYSENFKLYPSVEKLSKIFGIGKENLFKVRNYYISLDLNLFGLTSEFKTKKKKNDKCFVNKDGKFIMINKSDLDKYLSNGYERGKTSSMAKKEDVLEYYLQGHTIDETHHHFHIDPEAVKEKLGIKKEDPNRWFYKDGRSIKLKVNKELQDMFFERGWIIKYVPRIKKP